MTWARAEAASIPGIELCLSRGLKRADWLFFILFNYQKMKFIKWLFKKVFLKKCCQ